jgi:hypothetical protein
MKKLICSLFALLIFVLPAPAQDFVHPGSWITQAGCDRIRTNVAAGKEPWASAWQTLKNSEANADYKVSVQRGASS